MHVWHHVTKESDGIVLIEDVHRVHPRKAGYLQRAVLLGLERPRCRFVPFHRRVAVDADDKDVAKKRCVPYAADVAVMDDIESAIGGDDGLPFPTPGRAALPELFGSEDFRRGIHRFHLLPPRLSA
jgi:hypothetical protein